MARGADRPSRPPVLGTRRLAAAGHPELHRRAGAARGVRAARAPPAVARATGGRGAAGHRRLLGRAPRAHALDLPVRVSAHGGGTAWRRPDRGGGSAQPRRRARVRLLADHPPHASTLPRGGGAPRGALRALRLRRGVADGLLDAHDRHLRALRVAARARRRGDPRARPGRARRRGRPPCLALEAPRGDLQEHPRRRPSRRARPARALEVACARLLLRGPRPPARPPARRPRLVVGPGRPDHRSGGDRLGGRAQLGLHRRHHGGRRRRRRPAGGRARVALPVARLARRSSASPCRRARCPGSRSRWRSSSSGSAQASSTRVSGSSCSRT